MLIKIFLVCIAFFFFQNIELIAQNNNSWTSSYSSKAVVNLSDRDTPFWGWANQNGLVDPNSSNLLNSITLSSPNMKVIRGLKASFHSELLSRFSEENTFFFPELYGALATENFDLRIGRFFRTQVLGQDNTNTIGSLLIGNNANALTGFEFRNKRFLSVPLFQGYLKYKFTFGNYLLPNNRFVEDAFFHSKDFYLQLHIGRYRLSAGIIHNVFWGGISPTVGRLPSSLSDFRRAIFNNSAGSGAPSGEQINRLGNSVSGYDYAMSYRFDSFDVQISKLFFIEDRPASRHRSPFDGQWNATFNLKSGRFIDQIVYDHVNTKRQDAKFFEPFGRANYYTHSIYRSGFTNGNFVLGNPLIEFNFGDDGINRSVNNVLVAHHIGIQGQFSEKVFYTQKITYSRNYGVCFDQLVVPGGCDFEPEDGVELIPLSELREDAYYFSSSIEMLLFEPNDISGSFTLNYDFRGGEQTIGFVLGFKMSVL